MSFKINYKGTNCRGIRYEYKCTCGATKKVNMTASDESRVHCNECHSTMYRIITSAPSLDADLHDSMLTRNIGWDL